MKKECRTYGKVEINDHAEKPHVCVIWLSIVSDIGGVSGGQFPAEDPLFGSCLLYRPGPLALS